MQLVFVGLNWIQLVCIVFYSIEYYILFIILILAICSFCTATPTYVYCIFNQQ